MNTVYVDTSALLPLLDRDDADHPAVVGAVKELGITNALTLDKHFIQQGFSVLP